jgi:hypothetical protein
MFACGWIKPYGVRFIGLSGMVWVHMLEVGIDGLRLWQVDSKDRMDREKTDCGRMKFRRNLLWSW